MKILRISKKTIKAIKTLSIVMILGLIILALFVIPRNSSSFEAFIIIVVILIVCFTILLITFVIIVKRQKNIHKIFLRTITNYLDVFSLSDDEKIICCKICKLQIKPEHLIYKCPNCSNLFHKHHLLMWFNVKSNCPVCKYDFVNEMTLENKKRIKKIDQNKKLVV
ncbi:MAG TPA: RING-H2 finger protein [Candidatus Bathyarchaeia archaeon]|nr:RING-H2 finger protein [Candidatus Bathyarchaeia archaeon]